VPGGSELARLAGQALDALEREARESIALPLSNIALDLLALALAEQSSAAAPPPMATMRVAWARAQVLDGLQDPALSPQSVAARQGVSPRLLQRLFAADGASLAGFIREQRLQRCRDALADSAQAHRSITEIALAWGFNDPAHFTRAFRRRFNLAPRDWRAAAADVHRRGRGDGASRH
jgi:AraC-like DNA-binding protein